MQGTINEAFHSGAVSNRHMFVGFSSLLLWLAPVLFFTQIDGIPLHFLHECDREGERQSALSWNLSL
jgi:hypothetical protein